MSEKFVDSVWLETIDCANCGMKFAATTDFIRRRREDSTSFFCPLGHSNVYRESEVDRLRKAVERKDRELVEKNIQLCDTRQRLSGIAKANMKMRERVVNGICPCCNRTFQNLMRHMKTEHPDFSSKQALHVLRTAFGLTQYGAAKEIGVSPAYVSNYERGKYTPQRAQERIAEWIESHSIEPTP